MYTDWGSEAGLLECLDMERSSVVIFSMPRHSNSQGGRNERANPPFRDEDLPHHDDPVWVRRRKIRVVAAVRGGVIPLYVALERFHLTAKEFVEWEREVGEDLARKKNIVRAMIAGRPKLSSKKRRTRK
jgi:hypothetical protein